MKALASSQIYFWQESKLQKNVFALMQHKDGEKVAFILNLSLSDHSLNFGVMFFTTIYNCLQILYLKWVSKPVQSSRGPLSEIKAFLSVISADAAGVWNSVGKLHCRSRAHLQGMMKCL